MGHSSLIPPWWDREHDESGRPIRTDVREAAQRVWQRVCVEVQKVLGDFTDAGELLEKAVAAVSIYLEKQNAEPHDPSKLLIVAVYRLARRLARQRGRVQAIGGVSDLAEILRAPDWIDEADRRITLQKLVSHLSPESQGLLHLRMKGFEWAEIGRMCRGEPAALKLKFWRDVRRAHEAILRTPSPDVGKEKK